MRRRAVLAGGLALAACRRRERRVIAVIPKSTAHVFWLSVEAGAREAGREYGVDIDWSGPPAETEYSRQIQIVDSYVARRVDGIVLAACERKALVAAVDRAAAAGIPVTVFDSGLDSDRYMTFVATDNVEAGRLGARTLGKLLNGRGKVGVVQHAPGSFSTMDRENGFEEVMKKDFPGIRIMGRQYGMADRAKAMAAAENMMTAFPDLDGFFTSTEPSASGTAQAVKARGAAGKIRLVAFDFSDNLIEDTRAGVIDAMVVQDPFRMGFKAVQTVVDKLNGGTPPKRIDLPARVVTRLDLDKPEIRRLLFPDWKKGAKP